jgi:hypothetical protein
VVSDEQVYATEQGAVAASFRPGPGPPDLTSPVTDAPVHALVSTPARHPTRQRIGRGATSRLTGRGSVRVATTTPPTPMPRSRPEPPSRAGLGPRDISGGGRAEPRITTSARAARRDATIGPSVARPTFPTGEDFSILIFLFNISKIISPNFFFQI